MSHDPTTEDLDALAKKLLADRDMCVLTPRDRINALSQKLVAFNQSSGATLFRVDEKIPVTEGMGS